MVFRLITPIFLRPVTVEHEVGKRFVVQEDFIVLSVKHGVKLHENFISDWDTWKRSMGLVRRKEKFGEKGC